jgi:DNA-binding XRE family transcriptional regulator
VFCPKSGIGRPNRRRINRFDGGLIAGRHVDLMTVGENRRCIRGLRQRAQMSQAVFAHLLNVTVGYVSQLERGVKRPTGTALVLLNVIRRKGIAAIL